MMDTRGLKTSGKQGHKVRLLAEIAPDGFDAGAWEAHLHMVHTGGPATRPRVMTRDRGMLEIDRRSRTVRAWGGSGIAYELAAALAQAGGWEVESLDGVVNLRRPEPRGALPLGGAGPVLGTLQDSLAQWWRTRGYDALATTEGVWVDAGTTRIRDLGDSMELHGPVSDEAIVATVMKAKETWDGGMELYGAWTQSEVDRIWTECQRQDVEVGSCVPSRRAMEAWDREKAAARERDDTLTRVRAGVTEAERLKDAAGGDPGDLNRLSPELRAFLTSTLDDDQRAELRAQPLDAIIPELARFRRLGAAEIEEARRSDAPDPGAEIPGPQSAPPMCKAPAPAPRYAG